MGILDILSKKGVIESESIPRIEKEIVASSKTIDEVLFDMGVDSEEVLNAKVEYFNLPSRRVGEEAIPINILEKIPEKSAEHYKFIPLGIDDEGFLEVGIVDPDNMETRDALQFVSSKSNLPFKLIIITLEDFKKVLAGYRGFRGEVTKALSELEIETAIKSPKEVTGGKKLGETLKIKKGLEETTIIEEAPVTKIVATILRYAVEGGASDVHIEHTGSKIRVRFRVDGILHTSLVLPVSVHSAVVARIKVLSNMKLDEKRKPQDGRFSAKIEGRKIDFRVSTFPAYYGEKVVMRILESEKGVKGLNEIGLSEENRETIRRALKRPYGMILISGPTGSGKSTTLYSMLQEVDREAKNVLSLEDPVEFNIEGVSQSQVRPEIGYTFASGLRTALRQDPDIIMVGEIRDKETAALAIQASLTGHLVFSTIHTNSAVGVIPRLIDMGVDPYLIAPTLVLAMAQRLSRTLCPDSGKSIPIEGSIKSMVDKEFSQLPEDKLRQIKIPDYIYEISSSPTCPRGTKGRTGVYEVIEMNKEIEEGILTNPTSENIEKIVRSQGVYTMKIDALFKAFDKIIPLEEVNKL